VCTRTMSYRLLLHGLGLRETRAAYPVNVICSRIGCILQMLGVGKICLCQILQQTFAVAGECLLRRGR